MTSLNIAGIICIFILIGPMKFHKCAYVSIMNSVNEYCNHVT